jgi:cofilin
LCTPTKAFCRVSKLAEYNDYLADLKQKDGESDDCRYGLYDYDYLYSPAGAESINRSKIFLMSWCPDTSRIKKKMLYSASFETLQKAFVGVHKVIQANDESDLEQNTVEEQLRANDRNESFCAIFFFFLLYSN